jgi:hypothetical protein
VLQGYFIAQRHASVWAPRLLSVLLMLLALLGAAGTASVTMILWWPAIR